MEFYEYIKKKHQIEINGLACNLVISFSLESRSSLSILS